MNNLAVHKQIRAAQRELHRHIYRPYRPTATWVYNNVQFTFCANVEDTVYLSCKECPLIQLPENGEPYVWVHEMGHFLYDQLPPLLRKKLELELIQACYNVKDFKAFVQYADSIGITNTQTYYTLIDAYNILYNIGADTYDDIGHDVGYGKTNPVLFATTEAWAGACEYFMLRYNEPVPTIMQNFYKLCKQCLKWLDDIKVYHRSR